MRLTKQQAAVIGAYTGYAAGPFEDIQEYAEKLLGRPIQTIEFAFKPLVEKLRQAAKPDFIALCHDEDEEEA
jgi:hypothetical protein